jgi:hypothetical protein
MDTWFAFRDAGEAIVVSLLTAATRGSGPRRKLPRRSIGSGLRSWAGWLRLASVRGIPAESSVCMSPRRSEPARLGALTAPTALRGFPTEESARRSPSVGNAMGRRLLLKWPATRDATVLGIGPSSSRRFRANASGRHPAGRPPHRERDGRVSREGSVGQGDFRTSGGRVDQRQPRVGRS